LFLSRELFCEQGSSGDSKLTAQEDPSVPKMITGLRILSQDLAAVAGDTVLYEGS